MKFIFSLLCTLAAVFPLQAQQHLIDPAKELEKALSQKDEIDAVKEQRIAALKKRASAPRLTLEEKLDWNQKLYKEYWKYKTDSAAAYLENSLELLEPGEQPDLRTLLSIKLAGLYSTQGLYLESKAILDSIDAKTLNKELVPLYYEAYSNYFSHYGQSNGSSLSFQQSERYRDSLLQVLPVNSEQYQFMEGINLHFEGNNAESERILLSLLEHKDFSDSLYASIAYFLSLVYKDRQDIEKQTYYLSLSALADIHNSTKDNASFQALALMYFDQGDVDKAYVFMESAINDALFSSVRYRNMENSSFYPIINATFNEKEEFKKKALWQYVFLISLLSIVLTVGIVYFYQQMKKLSRARKQLDVNNAMLLNLNKDLEKINSQLRDSNHIKEEYIAHFFYVCSSYIEKIERYRKILLKKASLNQFDEILNDLKSPQIEQRELKELYKNFDVIILNLYPNFIEEFNQLLDEDKIIIPKTGELLNPELRIFALIRLGITDNLKIATFLRYSLRTVYNYRTRARNRVTDAREELEERVQQIGALEG